VHHVATHATSLIGLLALLVGQLVGQAFLMPRVYSHFVVTCGYFGELVHQLVVITHTYVTSHTTSGGQLEEESTSNSTTSVNFCMISYYIFG